MKNQRTKEPQYQPLVELRAKKGLTPLGIVANQVWHDDPRRLLFMLSRYKFVSKMLSGKESVLEVGCGDAFGVRVIMQEVKKVCAVDFDPVFVQDAAARMEIPWAFECAVHDMLAGPVRRKKRFDAAYSLDVLEHIPWKKENIFMSNIVKSLTDHGILLIGMPTLESQRFASKRSKEGHVNCKDHKQLKRLMSRYFNNVFIFSMNDEVVHTGFYPMAHYLFALGTDRRK
jgi:cyclopropane fatty-acyl-phospholipid synthase-like methyltransferase